MRYPLYLRRQLRSMPVVAGAFAAVGAAYELLTSDVLTLAGPVLGVFVSLPLVLLETLFPMPFLRRWPFAAIVLVKALLYIGIILVVVLGGAFIDGLLAGLTLRDFSREVWSRSTAGKVGVAFAAYVAVLFFRQLDRLLGPGTLVRYLFGGYHRPRQEARIFMFLDLKGSTSIAERLDVGAYYALLNDFFHDLAEPVLAAKAQIYQYIGDEVVLTWPLAQGLHDANCVRVFYEIEAAVRRNGSYYLARYGLIPEFKAGLHGGEVIRAEIGDLKRDLVYSGDVLNTTARIQAECNRFEARLLVSSSLYERLALPSGVAAEDLGEVDLRGKRHALRLLRLDRRSEAPLRVAAPQGVRKN